MTLSNYFKIELPKLFIQAEIPKVCDDYCPFSANFFHICRKLTGKCPTQLDKQSVNKNRLLTRYRPVSKVITSVSLKVDNKATALWLK